MSKDTTADLLISRLFKSTNQKDPEKTVSAKIFRGTQVQEIKQTIFEKQAVDCNGVNLSNLIPDVTNKPHFYVAFDFASTFAVNYTLKKNSEDYAVVKGERLVEDWLIDQAFSQLNDYKNYYYTVLKSLTGKNVTYEKSGDYGSIASGSALDTQINFINSMLNNFLTSVTVNRVCNDISTCTLSFRDSPNYDKAGRLTHLFSFTYQSIHQQLFIPMIPFTVWARGRIYDQFNIPIFTGYITRVTPTNNQGFTSFTIDGRDTLELARITVENVNPSLLQMAEPNTKELNFYSKVFYGADHFQLVQAMFIGGALTYDDHGKRVIQLGDPSNKALQSGVPRIYPIGSFDSYDEGKSDLTPDVALDRCAYYADDFSWNAMLQQLRQKKKVVCWGYNLTPFKTFGTSTPDVYTSNFSNRLEILQDVATTVYHEFYTDGCGNVHYHPMRLSNDFLEYDSFYPEAVAINNFEMKSKLKVHKHPLPHCQVVSDHETTSLSRSHNVENCVSYLVVHGLPTVDSLTKHAHVIGLIDYVLDEYYLTRYGYRRRDVPIPMFNENPDIKDKDGSDTKLSKALANAIINYLNGELYTMTASFVFRPELGLALPIYLQESKEVFYIRSISHTIDIGSNASTVINASFGRVHWLPAVDLISYMVKAEAFYLTGEVPITAELDQVTGLQKSLNLVLPLTLHSSDMIKKYEQIAQAAEDAANSYKYGIYKSRSQ